MPFQAIGLKICFGAAGLPKQLYAHRGEVVAVSFILENDLPGGK